MGADEKLLQACVEGDVTAVKKLLSAGAGIDSKGEYGDTPLHRAARYGHANVATLLLEAGAGIDSTRKDGDTPLHIAARRGKANVARLLLEAGADTTIKNVLNDRAEDKATESVRPLFESYSSEYYTAAVASLSQLTLEPSTSSRAPIDRD